MHTAMHMPRTALCVLFACAAVTACADRESPVEPSAAASALLKRNGNGPPLRAATTPNGS